MKEKKVKRGAFVMGRADEKYLFGILFIPFADQRRCGRGGLNFPLLHLGLPIVRPFEVSQLEAS